ncbi:pyruvate carboxylase [Desulfohalobium retbaense]|uniref:pyruvate carboxylase n=1 Tax=Desulfohalobium retbaense (strain ATCC 49708 / DSM 5692 / JCM 16813 / HR100) TaxID=485915 RepID=C8X0N5_DESRD|nr:pyruvate carboxylase [Desulfohalobium retbaense]ACV67982.1 Carbamoyl-phosphate synthase L chain ATP- binding protein [Desulfohalobium retbaense DSM 5692]
MQEKSFEQVLEELRGQPILVANRGIPARRIARSIREVFKGVPIMTATEVDKTAPFTTGAQELLLLGSSPQAYLDVDLIIRRAKARGVKAIHPGWGFASEDEAFPEKCRAAGLVFIGPPSRPMHILGNKVQVRNLAKEHGVPVVPGSDGAVSIDEARRIAEDIDFPIMLKAEGGGGGRGIYEVYQQSELERAFAKASSLAQASFGNPRLYVEKLLTSIRHIEIQVIADQHGNVFAFDERDCTVQRNHQKLVEITPSPWPVMTEELRERLKEYSRRLVSAVGYHSLATVEFLVDMEGNPYLIEVNTRLQVEHGITECRYGIDLVEEQIAVAFGAKLRLDDAKPCPGNHALQVRINCEDPQDGFAPNAGRITRYLSPGGQGVRVDSCLAAGYEFPSQYDSAASLLIAYGRDWSKVLGVMERALSEYVISGVKTTISFHQRIIANPQFRSGDYDTTFVGKTPQLLEYVSKEAEAQRLGRLVCEISAYGHNPFVQLGEYRGRSDKRLGALDVVQPEVDFDAIESPYPRGDRQALLDYVRDTEHVHFTDTTTRDITQSNSGNRFRLAEDRLIGPYLDNCGFFSLENGGGAHFHVAMLANMTYPFTEAREWNEFAPKTPKQILIRSTNVLGYKPQPKNLMQRTGEMICEHYDIIRCFDFLNHIENMRPFAEVAANTRGNVFEPALSLSWTKGFDVDHYMQATEAVVRLMADVTGKDPRQATRVFSLGLKDMAGVCPPRFIRELVRRIRSTYPELVVHYHRHYTDGLFVPAVGAAAEAGAHIVDTAIGATVRWYGQGEVLSTAAYIEDEIGRATNLNKDMIRDCNFVAKQIMPYYDRYTAPYFQGIDYDVVEHGMPGGATSSSQEGAMKQGYIHLLPYMLRFLAGTRKIVRYHDVTPGSQITWNTAFLAVTGAFKRDGEKGVQRLLRILESVVTTPEDSLSEALRKARLELYQDSNDAFRQLLLGRYGKLPLGFPPDWVYESAFGKEYTTALEKRTEESPLTYLQDMDLDKEREALHKAIGREPSQEEVVMYCNHPGDALKTIDFRHQYGDPNQLPLHAWFEGLQDGEEIYFNDRHGKPHHLLVRDVTDPDESGVSVVRYALDSESFTLPVQVAEPSGKSNTDVERADPNDPYQVAAPSNGDLWVMHVQPGEQVRKGEELFNISIMKQEKAVVAPIDGIVERVVKTADYMDDKKMVPVKEGELLVVLAPPKRTCLECGEPFPKENCTFCPSCGTRCAS